MDMILILSLIFLLLIFIWLVTVFTARSFTFLASRNTLQEHLFDMHPTLQVHLITLRSA